MLNEMTSVRGLFNWLSGFSTPNSSNDAAMNHTLCSGVHARRAFNLLII